MPTPKNKHRTYCKTCQDFTIHNADLFCKTCNTEFTSYFPSEINSDLIEQQRERYNKQKQNDLLGVYGAFIKGFGIQALMVANDEYEKGKIIECNAGQKER